MTSKRDSGLFASNSLSRSLGAQLSRTGSYESLAAHPLLSPTIPGSSASSINSMTSTGTGDATTTASSPTAPTPRYVPYTPRQRPAVTTTGTTTTGTMHSTVQASSQPHPFHGDATSKLQLMNLKAAAQTGGLDAASTGWAILERLGTETDHSAEWNDIWTALSTNKATLLLPLDTHPANEPITVEFIKDHVAICDGAHRKGAPVITLSGLRGILEEETLIFRSSLNPSSKHFQAILNPTTRTSALAALPPLPIFSFSAPASPIPNHTPSPTTHMFPSITAVSTPHYPTYTLPLHHASLPLPPRPTAGGPSSPAKPPLPPRPNARTVSLGTTNTPPVASSRLSTSFASLFGRAATPPPPSSPTVSTLPLHADTSASADSHTEPGLGVPAFTLNTRIIRRDVAKGVLKAIHTEIKRDLDHAPSWVSERLEEFAAKCELLPFVKNKPKNSLKLVAGSGAGDVVAQAGYSVPKEISGEDGVEELGRRCQEFYLDLEEELARRKWRVGKFLGHSPHVNGAVSVESASASSGDEKEKDGDDGDDQVEDEKEKRIREMLENVERTLCSMFYDRLFLQSCSDDASHDEALSSRIAAVNLLDLSLAHLGVDVGTSGVEVEAVVKACGETLSQLDTACRAPADKAAVLVASHKIIVDGLSRLPPIRLKPEEEHLDEKTPRASSFGKHTNTTVDVDDDDDSDKPQDSNTWSGASMPAVDSDKTIVLEDVSKLVASPDSSTPPESLNSGLAPAAPSNLSLTVPPPPSTSSPKLTISPAPPANPTPVSGDIILPLMIFAVVKTNPPHLVSHLLYTQRFRWEAVGGEEAYCLINLLAVAEFLENVDLAALGLGEKEKTVLSTAELTPIPVTRAAGQPPSPHSIHASLRGRVEQQVDAIAGSANKVISGVVDTSFGVLRAFLPGTPNPEGTTERRAGAEGQQESMWNSRTPSFGLLRRDTGFSIAGLAASLPGAAKPKKDEESGQQLLEVPLSRPGSSRSMRLEDASGSSAESAESDEADESEDDEDGEVEYEEAEHDTRSIRSFESMMSSRRAKGKRKGRPRMNSTASGRKSIADRLASVTGLARLSGAQAAAAAAHEAAKGSPPPSRRSSLLLPSLVAASSSNRYADTPLSSRAPSPIAIRISPPNQRFLECTADDIKVSEVGELLKEYKRLVEAVRAMGGFHDE
ncbi:hypothetical protein EUX98_g2138 [Antrodiella citrinella]|uniref:VPS9 domain-containing protein n=1 Tax=Antrodiella citrinella TaxID=2447956 RepID=A0A4S4N826_9APHY|nr:hypothetical protein EUX98_g2138 [Antrodiella citrinella]